MEKHNPLRLSVTLTTAHQGMKVQQILQTELGLSSSVIRRIKWLEEGILLDGQRVTTRTQGTPGQVLSALIGEEGGDTSVIPMPGEVDIRYQDPHCIVVNKAPGVAVHPSYGHYADTLGNFLLHYYKTQGERCGFHPVHRLDIGTSGLMILAKHPHAQESLTKQLHTNSFQREYWAVTQGVLSPSQGTLTHPIHQLEGEIKRIVHPQGKPATTHYTRLAHWVGKDSVPLSLAELRLETGRTHQIRVHLAHQGNPLVGDSLYGGDSVLGEMEWTRPALHSRRLSFQHPITHQTLEFVAPLPPDMTQVLADCPWKRGGIEEGEQGGNL